jgi:hypothetical protein
MAHLSTPAPPQPASAQVLGRPWAKVLWGVLLCSLTVTSLHAQTLRCHVAYAGAQRSFVVPPVVRDQEAQPLLEGATFVLQVVNKVAPFEDAAVKVSTYTAAAGEPKLLHQATYTDTAARSAHGFTGLQAVQEPTKAHELRYWCERSGQ